MSLPKWLDRHLEHSILGVLLAILTILSFMNVVMRYVFGAGLSWSDEVCRYCLVLSGFFSLPCWIRYKSGIRVDLLINMFPEKLRTGFEFTCNIMMIIFLVILLKGTIDVHHTVSRVNQLTPALQLPKAYLYAAVAAAFSLAIVRYVQVIIMDIRKLKNGNTVETEGAAAL